MNNLNPLDLLLAARNKEAVVAAPRGQPQLMPPPGAAPPMDPAMMGGMPPGMPPMDPAMMGGMPPGMPPMDPAMMGGMPPMDPAMMGGAPPMDPAMMGGMPPEGTPPPVPAMNIEQEIIDIKEMLQALMESQIALMQTLGGGMPAPQSMPMPPMDPAMMGGMPTMDPAMMGGGMQVTASHVEHKAAQDKEFADYMRTIADLLR